MDIGILYVALVFAKMKRDTVRPCFLSSQCYGNRIWLNHLLRHFMRITIARLT